MLGLLTYFKIVFFFNCLEIGDGPCGLGNLILNDKVETIGLKFSEIHVPSKKRLAFDMGLKIFGQKYN